MSISRKTIGQRIKALRAASHQTQAQFALPLGIRAKTLSSYEVGDSYPPLDVLTKLATVCTTSINWLLYGVDMPDTERGQLQTRELLLLEYFRRSDDTDQEMLLRIAEITATVRQKPEGKRKEE